VQNKNVLFLVVCAAMVLMTAGCNSPSISASFKTPEDAINSYMQAVAQGDGSKILQAFAINEMSEKYNFEVFVDRIGAFQPIQFEGPTNYTLYVDLNKTQVAAQIVQRVRTFIYGLLSTEDVASGNMIGSFDAERAAKFIKEVDPKRLSGISVKRIDMPNKPILNSDRHRDNLAKTARMYGADESTERVALFTFEGNTYVVGFSLLRYGDGWKIYQPGSVLSGLNPLGTAAKITEADFDKMVNGN